jgi:hypothetical protein
MAIGGDGRQRPFQSRRIGIAQPHIEPRAGKDDGPSPADQARSNDCDMIHGFISPRPATRGG